ncbi:MAG TPA: alpha/beta fold hydrolase [Actinomycetota bacterium]|nr:alpha/beta fold hydrolase [Actinomycetota bacterium]
MDDLLGHESAGSGPVLVLIHGFPFDRRMWAAQGALAQGRRVVALDLPGRGLSAGMSVEGATIDGYADRVADLIKAETHGLGGQADVSGLSMGGYVAFSLWRRHPELVRSLILSGTRAGADSEEGRAARTANADIAWAEGTIGLAETMLDKILAPTTGDEVRNRVIQMFDETPALTAIADLVAMRDRADSTDLLGTIIVPTLVLRGSEDAIAGEADAKAMAAAINGARFATIPAAGHLAPMESPDGWNEAVREFYSHSIVAGGLDEMS